MSAHAWLKLRPWLVLGRVSNLPTVWTNCVAGWALGGGGEIAGLALLGLGASLLYLAGMFLNDAFDADFDRQRRRERPIPAGQVQERTVWLAGFVMLAIGWASFHRLGPDTGFFGAMLAAAIVIYDAVHKAAAFSPVLMAACRFLLFLAAASAGSDGVTGLAIWSGIALAFWIVGLSYVARRESFPNTPLKNWPLWALAAPLVLAVFANQGEFRWRALMLGLLLLLWTGRCLRFTRGEGRNLGRAVSGLLAGICLVDLLALAPGGPMIWVFVACFGASLLAQRHVPAT